jgi:ferrous-iron efflux pump FieF
MTLLKNNDLLKKAAAAAGVGLASLLILVKFFAFIKTDSLAVFSSMIDSVTDLFSSLISFVAVYFSTKPASKNHRYGYGKSEALSALLQAFFVGFSGLFVLIDGINRLIHPITVSETGIGIFIMLFSIVMTLFLVLFQLYVAKKTNSLAIRADTAHYTVDFLTNSAVIVSLLLVHYTGFAYFDALAAVIISVYLLHNAYLLAAESIGLITDKELSSEIRASITDIVKNSEGIRGMHDLRSRSLGNTYYFEMHLEIDGNVPLLKAHELTDHVEQKILALYPDSQILIHQDPYGLCEERLDNKIDGTRPSCLPDA